MEDTRNEARKEGMLKMKETGRTKRERQHGTIGGGRMWGLGHSHVKLIPSHHL